ncbi:hypothetical protein SLEP1_g15197 [Rubroshorea leprosula]|uniref:Ribosomal protein L33 n=1 Tax=Rubroshorea leprosula TaxID=152421 RepID=A0AAV5IVZ6_9ROSI|nr:hypothetical protein SLEP1_g15197 [Rubroshorea leprosula]
MEEREYYIYVTPQNPNPRRYRRRALVRRVPQMHKARNLSYHTLIPPKSEDQIIKISSHIIKSPNTRS